jgi:hypothetical protein
MDRTVTFTLGNLSPSSVSSVSIQTQLQTGYILGTGEKLIFDTLIMTDGAEITYVDNADRDLLDFELTPAVQIIKTTSTPLLMS